MASPLAATKCADPAGGALVKLVSSVNEKFPICVPFPVPLVVIVGGLTVSFPWKQPLKGTCFCAAAGMASAVAKITEATVTQVFDFVVDFICAPLRSFNQAANSHPAHLP